VTTVTIKERIVMIKGVKHHTLHTLSFSLARHPR